jgi:hypothetical protein
MKLIETRTLLSFAASITFSNIPQDGTDLLLLVSDRSDRSAGAVNDAIFLKLNNANSSGRRIFGNGSSITADTSVAIISNASSSTSNVFSNIQFYIPNYSSSTANKSWTSDGVMEHGGNPAYQTLGTGLYSSTSPVTSIVLAVEAGTGFVANTTASLYKITKGSDGITTVS